MNIPEGAVPLAVGTLLAMTALSVVLSPLIAPPERADEPLPEHKPRKQGAEGTAIAALREIEFDRATGKLSDKDYEALRATYTRRALLELRAEDANDAAQRPPHNTPLPAIEMNMNDKTPTKNDAADSQAIESNPAEARPMKIGAIITDDMVEAAIRRAKEAHSCKGCGLRPEPDALFCSNCGRYLASNCGHCQTSVELVDARFCVGCGQTLSSAIPAQWLSAVAAP